MESRTFDRLSRSLAGATSRRQALKLIGGGIAAGALGTVGLSQVATAQTTNPLTVPISGTGADGASFLGTFTLDRVLAQAGQLLGLGTLAGTVTRPNGTTQDISRAVQLPLTPSGTCQVLHLELGPLDLNLLGLRIQLNQVVLDITAQQGGGLLGDLLCSVANLLNNGGPLRGLTNLLNQILGSLGGV
jgi:hypothetical protein